MSSMIYVTFLEQEGSYIKVWGQTDKILPIGIEKALKQMTPQFDQGQSVLAPEGYQIGMLCCAKFKDGSYYRARITNTAFMHQGMVEVIFVDYGNRDYVPITNLRTMTNLTASLISIPPQAKDFILAGVTHAGNSWDTSVFEMISNEMRYLDLEYRIMTQVGNYVIITLSHSLQDIGTSILTRGYAVPIPLPIQQVMLQNMAPKLPVLQRTVSADVMMIPKSMPPGLKLPPGPMPMSAPIAQPTLLTYKSLPLEQGSEHTVYVSYVTDGPLLFSVQLQTMEDKLKQLMMEINTIPLQMLDESPLPGCVCLARSSEDEYICRAVVTSMVDGNFKVFYVDFGNTEVLPFAKLYQMPFKYVIPKVMATRFALSGLNNSVVSLDMKCSFKEFVNNKILYMRVVPPIQGTAVNLCDLWDENKTSALDFVKCSALHSYPDPVPLSRGFNQDVKVSFVYSCRRFYVQLKNKEEELNGLMQRLQEVCAEKPALNPSSIQEGTPCNALYEVDGMFYRAQIIELHGATVKVRYVDYGNEEMVALGCVRQPDVDLITVLRPQAIECCLSGYQNMSDDQERDDLFEELILEQDFSMKVVEIQGGKTLVDLFDPQHYNVASLLLEKIANKNSQVSPAALVQDNSRIELRKRTPPEGYSKRSPRDSNERTFNNKKDSWRDNKSRNQSDDEPKSDWRENKVNRGRQKRSALSHPPNNNRDDQHDNRNKRYDSNKNRNERNDNGWSNNKSPDYNAENKRKPRTDNGWSGGSMRSDNPSDYKRKPRNEEGGSMRSSEYSSDFKRKPRNDDAWGSNSAKSPEADSDFNKRRPRNEGHNDYNSRNKKGDGSEQSWDGSEKGSGRFQNKDDRRPRRENDNRNAGVRLKGGWENDAPLEVLSFAGPGDEFLKVDHTGKTEDVSISWFFNPASFYCHLESSKAEFSKMMSEIQSSYKKRKPSDAPFGSPVIALFPDDNALYRASIVEVNGATYKVFFVDFGNYSVTRKVYAIEKKHMEMPVQAYLCSIGGISPNGEAWPKSSSFGKYFEKDTLQCTFLSVNDGYNVDLSCDGNQIKDQLIADGLAIEMPAESFGAELELDLLLHQTVRCQLSSVNKLSDLLVQLQPGLFVQCGLYNLEKATELQEANVQKFLEQFVIAYVDKVENERLEVTLFDGAGLKIEAFSPDSPAFDSVSPILQVPIFSSTLTGLVTHATESTIFIQPTVFTEAIGYLLDGMFECYETSDEIPEAPVVGNVYAVHSSDGNWYRGKVCSVEIGNVTVVFLDYGNGETVENQALRELDPLHYEPHLLAIEVQFANGESLLEQEVTLNLSKQGELWEGQLKTEPTEVVQEVVTTEEQIPTQTSDETAVPAEETEYPSSQFGFSVILSHLDNPGQFYLQVTEAEDLIMELQDRLQAEIPELPDVENVTTGILCAAQYSVDQLWYRAQVLDSDPDITTVRFVDFGNTDVLDNTTSKVKTLPPELLTLEHHSKRCSLYLKPTDTEWSTEACEKFEQLVGENALMAEIIHQDEKTTFVDLYADNVNVGQELLKEKMAVELQLETSASCTGFVSNLNSPSEFWIQLESACNDLEWVADQLTGADDYPQLQDHEPGSLCAAVFPDDGNWYRARILSNTVAGEPKCDLMSNSGLEVLFVDYGNSCTCSSMRELPEDLVMLSPLAQKCSLQKPPGLLQWPAAATGKFKEVSADGITIFTVNKLSQGETSIVQLIHEGTDISTKLLPETFGATITGYGSIDDFSLKRADDDGVIEHCKLETLPGHVWGDEADGQLKEMDKEGQTVFQVELVSTNSVRLYLNDSDVRLTLTMVKATPASSVQGTPKKSTEKVKLETVSNTEDSVLVVEVENTVPEITEEEKNIEVQLLPEVTETNIEDHVTESVEEFVTSEEDLNKSASSGVYLSDEAEAEAVIKSPQRSAMEIMNQICDNVEKQVSPAEMFEIQETVNVISDNVVTECADTTSESVTPTMDEKCNKEEEKVTVTEIDPISVKMAMELVDEMVENVEKTSFLKCETAKLIIAKDSSPTAPSKRETIGPAGDCDISSGGSLSESVKLSDKTKLTDGTEFASGDCKSIKPVDLIEPDVS